MKLTNEEKRSILEEIHNKSLQEDIRSISGRSKRMNLEEYLNFLTALSNLSPKRSPSTHNPSFSRVIF